GLKRHHERLAGRELDRIGQLERVLTEPTQDLQADTGPGLWTGVAPRRHGRDRRRQQRVNVRVRVAHLQRYPERACLGGHPAGGARLVEREVVADIRLEGRLSLRRGVLAVYPRAGRLVEGGPVATLPDRGQRPVEGGSVLRVQLAHDAPPLRSRAP